MTSMASVNFGADGKCYSGSIDGSVYLWNGPSCLKSVSITTGFVNSICVSGEKVYAGGKDSIFVLDADLNKNGNIQTGAQVRAIDSDGTNVLVGLRDGTIVEFNNASEKNVLMESHSDGEAWGLAICPQTGLVNKYCRLYSSNVLFRLSLLVMITRSCLGIPRPEEVLPLALLTKFQVSRRRSVVHLHSVCSHQTNAAVLLVLTQRMDKSQSVLIMVKSISTVMPRPWSCSSRSSTHRNGLKSASTHLMEANSLLALMITLSIFMR